MNELKKEEGIGDNSCANKTNIDELLELEIKLSKALKDSGEKKITFLNILRMFMAEPVNISVAFIKRRFHMGFARANKIMECFENLHYVSAENDLNKREFLLSVERYRWLFKEYFSDDDIEKFDKKVVEYKVENEFPELYFDKESEYDEAENEEIKYGEMEIGNGPLSPEDKEYLDTVKFIAKQDIYCPPELKKKLVEIVAKKIIPLNTARSIARLIEKSNYRSSETDRNTFSKQIETIASLPYARYGKAYCDFAELEKALNKKVLHARVAIKALIRAFHSQLDSSNFGGATVCLVGPSKCGKSALIEEFCKIAGQYISRFDCTGVADSAVFEGSSYIYANGNPSRIVDIITEARICNPFVFFKNVDKLQTGRCEPSGTLSKFIARPNNAAYMDIFVNIPIDLSAVNFILTAESESDIPSVLRNQAIVIEMGNYELEEKVDIAINAIAPQVLEDNDLTAKNIKFERDGIVEIINVKAFEPGLAELIKIINDIISQEAENISENLTEKAIKVIVDRKYIVDYFKKKNAKEILRMTDSKFKSFRRLATHLPEYDANEQNKILERAKLSEYCLLPPEEAYFELLSRYPRGIVTVDATNFNAMKETVENYYGADEAKEQLLNLIASNMLSHRTNGIVIGLVGNAGTGKTNFAQTAAKILNKKFVSINMSNIDNPSIITGTNNHIGKIAQAFIDAGSENPVILIDELEKASVDVQNAMLLYLDPIQNNNLKDEYLNIAIPMQQAVIIATINDIERLSFPVYDRLDIICMNDYSPIDKVEIAKRSVIAKIVKKFGLEEKNIIFPDSVLSYVAKCYGIGAGFRRMEKALERIVGDCAKEIVSNDIKPDNYVKVICIEDVCKILGEPLVRERKIIAKDKTGVVNGLAICSLWGDVLPIEAIVYHGNGEYDLTGSLGEVMRESARVARAAVRKLLAEDCSDINIDKLGINLHAPAGAIKKDGPSAGIAIAVAIYSAIMGNKICGTLGMTGEINLQGEVLAVGGLEKKLLAGFSSGLTTILVPEENRNDIDKIQNIDIDKTHIRYISTLREALSIALVKKDKDLCV